MSSKSKFIVSSGVLVLAYLFVLVAGWFMANKYLLNREAFSFSIAGAIVYLILHLLIFFTSDLENKWLRRLRRWNYLVVIWVVIGILFFLNSGSGDNGMGPGYVYAFIIIPVWVIVTLVQFILLFIGWFQASRNRITPFIILIIIPLAYFLLGFVSKLMRGFQW